MDQEQALRDLLEKVEAPPSGITIDWVLPAGRRARRRRRAVWAAGTSVALTLGALVAALPALVRREAPPPVAPVVPAPQPAACQLRRLPLPAGAPDMRPVKVDPSGRYIVGQSTRSPYRAVFWIDGRPLLPESTTTMILTDVNAAGVAVGKVGDRNARAVRVTEDGGELRMTTMPGDWIVPDRPIINAAGEVLVSALRPGQRRDGPVTTLVWRADGQVVEVPLPADAYASSLSDDGRIVGRVKKLNDTVSAAYLWDQQGHGTKLTTPEGGNSEATELRGDRVAGYIHGPGQANTAAVWNLRTGELTGFPIRAAAPVPAGINAAGWVVVSRDGVYADGKPFLSPSHSDYFADLSDTGLVVGTTKDGPSAWQC
jgi:hypothetical protein